MVKKTNLDQLLVQGILSFLRVLFMEILMLATVVKAADLNAPMYHSLLSRAHGVYW